MVAKTKRFISRWDEIKCNIDCGRCNHKGTPSATKGSKLCLQLRKELPGNDDFSLLKTFKNLFNNKGKMRAFGRIKEKLIKNE